MTEYERKTYPGPADTGGQTLYWHRVYKIILAESEWKPCAGPGDAGGKDLYCHRVSKIILAECEWNPDDTGGQVLYWDRVYEIILDMSGNPVQDLVMQVDRSCTDTGFKQLFL